MNVTDKIMNKIYVKPSCTAIDVDAQQIICESDPKMGFSSTKKATHGQDPNGDVLVKEQSGWPTNW